MHAELPCHCSPNPEGRPGSSGGIHIVKRNEHLNSGEDVGGGNNGDNVGGDCGVRNRKAEPSVRGRNSCKA